MQDTLCTPPPPSTTHAPGSAVARISQALLDADRRRVNAEQVARFLQDDLTDAHARIEALEERLAEEVAKREAAEARLARYDARCLVPGALAALRAGR